MDFVPEMQGFRGVWRKKRQPDLSLENQILGRET
jgi:hypothetical protein